jgi:hypothetical protein
MSTVTGQATTFNLPNYHGELYQVSPTETPFLSAIGGINGSHAVHSTSFEWQTMGRRTSSANNSAKEGAATPAGSQQTRANITNVVEIHQSAVEVSYTKQAARGNFSGQNIAPLDNDPFIDEVSLQTMAELQSMAVDIEQSFLSGTLHVPTDNTTARATQGILGAAATVGANGGTNRAITPAIVTAQLQAMFSAGATLPQDTTVIMAGAAEKVALTNAYAAVTGTLLPQSRTVFGADLQSIVTPFGTFSVMLNRWMPAGQIGIINLAVCKPKFLEIPNKGLLFVEPVSKVGASDKYQLYGEIGLDYGPTTEHGLIKDLT